VFQTIGNHEGALKGDSEFYKKQQEMVSKFLPANFIGFNNDPLSLSSKVQFVAVGKNVVC